MKLKDLEKIKLAETTILVGCSIYFVKGLMLNGEQIRELTQGNLEQIREKMQEVIYISSKILLASSPRIIDALFTPKIETNTVEYKEIKKLYDTLISNLADFLKKLNITDPVEIFTTYQFMYRYGYLSNNKQFNYDLNTKDLPKLHGADIVRGLGVCRSIASFLTDVYKQMGYNACNLLVHTNTSFLDNIEKQGNYPKFKLTEQTQTGTKKIIKYTQLSKEANHLISMVEKNGKIYIFDPTNDAFLVHGKNNNLTLPEQKDNIMKIKQNLARNSRNYGNIKSTSLVKEQLTLPSIKYEEYKQIYKETLLYIKENIELIENFYNNNQELYLEIFEKMYSINPESKRLYPEINLYMWFKSLHNKKTNTHEKHTKK